jgi:hypothetical protein
MDEALDWAWFAGIFEGEGCIVTRMRGVHASMRVKMADRDVVERVAVVAGCGRVRADTPSGNPRHRDMWIWEAARRTDVIQLLDRLYPFMGERRRARIDTVMPQLRNPRRLVDDGWSCGGKPSSSAFKYGCRCDGCRTAKRDERKAYAA